MKRGPKSNPAIVARNARIADMFTQGVTQQRISEQFNLTRERVRQILAKQGITGQDGGMARRVQIAGGTTAELKAAARRRAAEQKYGVSYELLSALRAEKITLAYAGHRKSAAARGIRFELTLGQWWAIWQSSGHAHQRGVGRGTYCMSRINDKGGYVLGNVHIQPTEENAREAVKQWRGKPAKEHRGVFLLYPGLATPYMAKVGKKHLGLFATAEAAAEARSEYVAAYGLRLGSHAGVGRGKGWCFLPHRSKVRPYYMQGPGRVNASFSTQEEAEAAYKAACAAYLAQREATQQAA